MADECLSPILTLIFYRGGFYVYECFHCGERAVIWDSDFSFDDMGYEGDGIVHICHCTNCGAEIEYMIPFEEDEE